MMKRMLMAFGVAGLVAVSAVGAASAKQGYGGAGQPSANANCVGNERAAQNSNGGGRDHGVFGQMQSNYVAAINAGEKPYPGDYDNYGQFLQVWKADNC